jgi:hypothetical protein
MRDNDSIILESLYSKIIKEDVFGKKWDDRSEEEKERIKKYYPWMVPNWTDGLFIPDRIKSYFPDNPGSILKSQVAEAFYRDTVKKGIKCQYKVYQIFAIDSKDYSSEPDWDVEYLMNIEGKGLVGNPYDPVDMAEQNKDVNVLTIMNQILYPIKDMDQNYFNSVYENLFKTMVVEDYGDKGKSAYLFTTKNRKYLNMLLDYFGQRGFNVHRKFLIVLSQMIVNEFGDDPEINKDYSVLLTLGAFAY